ncbi:unknown [Sutterella wadsworthensis CAG:135]|nr:unknown [Sutterella wadsworthensis CAG:135]
MSRLGKLFYSHRIGSQNEHWRGFFFVFGKGVSDCRKGFVPSGNQFGAVSRNADF